MRCHYEVLGINRDANNDEIKKAYRKLALQWHPDKNADNIEEANKKFLEIQDAYETLTDEQERAWYDSHREVLLNGGINSDADKTVYVFNVYPYFTSSCFKGYNDDEKGFYSVYREVFKKIAEEDKQSYEEDIEIPDFGTSNSDYDTVVGTFYAFWQSYCTPRSFVWCEEHDTREANERYVRRLMEKDNKKLRDKAKKDRNEEIRNLVSFIRKKDKRVEQYKKFLEEKNKLAQKKSEEKRESDRLKRLEQMKNYVEPEWIRNTDEKFNELNIEGGEELDTDDNESIENDDYEDDEDFFCVACDKSFKSDKAFKNHEKSKKHKENIDLLKKTMKEEDLNLILNKQDEIEKEDEFEQDSNKKTSNEIKEEKPKNRMSKKQKKKHKLKAKEALQDSDENDLSEVNEEINQEESLVEIKEPEIQADTAEASSKPSICSVCKLEFESRNKLFEHIKAEGHAIVKTTVEKKAKNKKTKAKK